MDLQSVEASGQKVDEMVNAIIGNTTLELDNYLTQVRTCFLAQQEISDDSLNRIMLQIPVHLYPLIVLAQQIEMRKGVAKEQAAYTENDALLTATGTVQEKKAKAENQTAEDRLIQLAYTTAASIISRKIDGATAVLDSVKKVMANRTKEKVLTNMAGNAVGAF
jgi:predicted HNH restriction endonuclease